MGSIKEAMLRNGVFYFNNDGQTYTIEDGAGCYMVARDTSGVVRFRIESSELSSRLVVRDVHSNSVVQYLSIY